MDPQDEQSPQLSLLTTLRKNQTILVVMVSVLATGLLVGGGVFVWQRSENQKAQKHLEEQIESFRDQLEQVAGDKEVLEKQIGDLERVASEAAAEKEELERLTCKGEWKNGVCVKATCVDSDVNEKPDDIYIKGSVTSTDENGVETVVYDECTGSKTQVNEMWCYESPAGSGNYVPGKMVYDCPNGCLDGACIK